MPRLASFSDRKSKIEYLTHLFENTYMKDVLERYGIRREPEEYKIGDILRATEKDLAPVSCLAEGAPECERRSVCRTVDFWTGLNDTVNEYLDSKTLADLL